MFGRALKIALVIGAAIDLFVAALTLLFQPLIAPLLDIPVRDPLFTAFTGGELLVAAGVYIITLSDIGRYRPLLWLCALDQAIAVVLPALGVAHGDIPSNVKTVAPIVLQAGMCLFFVAAAARKPARA